MRKAFESQGFLANNRPLISAAQIGPIDFHAYRLVQGFGIQDEPILVFYADEVSLDSFEGPVDDLHFFSDKQRIMMFKVQEIGLECSDFHDFPFAAANRLSSRCKQSAGTGDTSEYMDIRFPRPQK